MQDILTQIQDIALRLGDGCRDTADQADGVAAAVTGSPQEANGLGGRRIYYDATPRSLSASTSAATLPTLSMGRPSGVGLPVTARRPLST